MSDKIERLRDILTVMKLSEELTLSGKEKTQLDKVTKTYLRAELGLPTE